MKNIPSKQGFALPFYKVHGAGNDMLVFRKCDLPLTGRKKVEYLRLFAHRQLGLGADQMLEIVSMKPLAIQIWNKDGSQAEMCANGARTFLYLAAQEKWIAAKAPQVSLVVSGKSYTAYKEAEGYSFSLGVPQVLGSELCRIKGESIPFWRVSAGNPHAIVFLKGEKKFRPWKKKDFSYLQWGPLLENHKLFPERTNVEFVRNWKQKGAQVDVWVDTWERGAGPTLSCGSGAVAVAGALRALLGASLVRVYMTEFCLSVRFSEDERAWLSGPSAIVAKGHYFAC